VHARELEGRKKLGGCKLQPQRETPHGRRGAEGRNRFLIIGRHVASKRQKAKTGYAEEDKQAADICSGEKTEEGFADFHLGCHKEKRLMGKG